jgi:hypothetical protein
MTWAEKRREKALNEARSKGLSPNQSADYATAVVLRATQGQSALRDSDKAAIAKVQGHG